MSNESPKPPLPPIPGAANPPAPVEVSSPTIVVNSIVHVPTPNPGRVQREATVVVKRATRPESKRSPLGWALAIAVAIVASAIAYVGLKRASENERRQQQIEQRIEEVRRQQQAE